MTGLRWMSAFSALSSLLFLFAGSPAEAFTTIPTDLVLQDPSILEDSEPIDVVYTYVDKADPEWKALRKKSLKLASDVLPQAKRKCGCRDFDELKYSLRSIYAFAPFVRHIFIVTSGKKPKWLVDHPMVTVVSHDQIFTDKDHLPTFNSVAVESNLHRIPDLASRYIYFTSDLFLGKNVTRHDFYERPYKIKVFLSQKKILDDGVKVDHVTKTLARNMCSFLESHTFGSDVQLKKDDLCYHAHTPLPMIKWIAELTEKQFPAVFASCSSHKFPSSKDMSITNGLIPQYALKHGAGVAVKNADSMTISFKGKPSHVQARIAALGERKPMFFCVKDISTTKANKVADAALRKFLEACFPNPAPWEHPVKRMHK